MFSRFTGLLFTALFVLTLNGTASAQECPSGYVAAASAKITNCKAEVDKAKDLNCVLECTDELDENGKCIPPKQANQECYGLREDILLCGFQCIPQVTNGGILPGPKDGSTAKNYLVSNFLPNLTNGFLVFIMVLGVGFLVAAGFMWIFSAGNEELSSRARRTVIWTIIGLIVAVISYLLVQIVININFFS